MRDGSFIGLANRTFFLPADGGVVEELLDAAPPTTPFEQPAPTFLRTLESLDDTLRWCVDERHHSLITELQVAMSRTPIFSGAGKSPLAPTSAARIVALIGREYGSRALRIALVGDLELLAMALSTAGHAVTAFIDDQSAWRALLSEHGDIRVRPFDVRRALVDDDFESTSADAHFDLAIVDLNTQTDGYVALLSRALSLVDEDGVVGVISHPRLRDKALPLIFSALPIEDDVQTLVDMLPRLVPGPALMGEHWDLSIMVRSEEALPLLPTESCTKTRAADLDPDLYTMLAEEIHGHESDVTSEMVDRALSLLDVAWFQPESSRTLDDEFGSKRSVALEDGGFLDVTSVHETALVSVCLGGYFPRRFLEIAYAFRVALPPRRADVEFP